MNYAKWASRAAAAAASIGLVAMSSSASAQYGNSQYCSNVAWVVCGYDESYRPIQPTVECVDEEYEACMNGYGTLGAKSPSPYDKQRDVKLA
ncbi:MAG TPA: hypothetical protein VF620_07150 [Allosphingosinicella sp.]